MAVNKSGPLIEWLFDENSRAEVTASAFLNRSEADIFGTRLRLKQLEKRGEKWLVCLLCRQPVYLAGRVDRQSFWFKHYEERGDCPIKTRGRLSQEELRRAIYHGARESKEHLQLKDLICRSLAADPQCSTIDVEKHFYSPVEIDKWRQPDVRASIGGRHIAFEVQRSSTFIDVITERWNFYTKAKVFLVWILPRLNEEHQLFTVKDVLYGNNRNVYVVNEQTLERSLTERKFILGCHYHEPAVSEGKVVPVWRSQYVSLDSLHFDAERNRVYAFDAETAFATALATPVSPAKQLNGLDSLRDSFEDFWLNGPSRPEVDWRSELTRFSQNFRSLGLSPKETFPTPRRPILNALYSVKHGRVVGYGFQDLLQVAHWVDTAYRPYLRHFWWLANAYQHADGIKALDKTGKLQRKLELAKTEIKAGNAAFAPDRTYDDLLCFLFPPLSRHLRSGAPA
jgi:hypothetical protein